MDVLNTDLHLMKLDEKRTMFMLVAMYRIGRDYHILDMNLPDIVLRNRDKIRLKIAFSNKGRGKRNPFYLCKNTWNRLDIETQRYDNIFVFKNQTRKMKLSNLNVYILI